MEYIAKGQCIFCKRTKEDTATFKEKAHTIPESLGSSNIGVDICDDCNHYFGQPDPTIYRPVLGVELAVKEVLGVQRALLRRDQNAPRLKYIFFEYWRKKNTFKFKNRFLYSDNTFLLMFGRQFRRGIYELFLQEYHRQYEDGLNPKFEKIRRFSRYNEGDVPLYYVQRRMGLYLMEDGKNGVFVPQFHFSDKLLEDMEQYGFFQLYLFGQIYYLEVTDKAAEHRYEYLNKEIHDTDIGGNIYSCITQVEKITDMDFLMSKLFGIHC